MTGPLEREAIIERLTAEIAANQREYRMAQLRYEAAQAQLQMHMGVLVAAMQAPWLALAAEIRAMPPHAR